MWYQASPYQGKNLFFKKLEPLNPSPNPHADSLCEYSIGSLWFIFKQIETYSDLK